MLAKNCTLQDMNKALAKINLKFGGNVEFKKIETQGRAIRFTLTVLKSSGPGGRLSAEGRRIAAACWHIHGEFFDALLDINPQAVIVSRQARIFATDSGHYGNWQDVNIGSNYRPFYYSDACACKG
jgi:hypothetical protein